MKYTFGLFIWIPAVFALVLLSVFGASSTLAQSFTPLPSGDPLPPAPGCPSNHIYVPGQGCVCRWGVFEVGITPVGGVQRGQSICTFVGSFGFNAPGEILRLVVLVLIVFVILVGVVSIVIGGYYYMTAGGSADRVRTAKIWIGSALLGIALALLAYVILNTISPTLV
jgi:hypothetical protein